MRVRRTQEWWNGAASPVAFYYVLSIAKSFHFNDYGALVAQSSGQAPFTSEFVGSNLGSDSLHSCEKS